MRTPLDNKFLRLGLTGGLIAMLFVMLWGAWQRLVGPNREATVSFTRAQLHNFRKALDLYINDHGRPPHGREGLRALLIARVGQAKQTHTGSYLGDCSEIPLDAWNNEYHYLSPGRKGDVYEVISYGADGRPGGSGYDADLSVTSSGAH